MGRGLSIGRTVALLAASVLTVPLVLFLSGTATVLMDGPPAGVECRYEIDAGSGWAGTGREEIGWSLYPTKYCVGEHSWADDEPVVVESAIHPFDLLTLAVFPAAAFVSGAVFVAGRYLLLHHHVLERVLNPRPVEVLVLYAAGLVAIWFASFAGALNWGVASSPLHLSTTPARDLVGGAL